MFIGKELLADSDVYGRIWHRALRRLRAQTDLTDVCFDVFTEPCNREDVFNNDMTMRSVSDQVNTLYRSDYYPVISLLRRSYSNWIPKSRLIFDKNKRISHFSRLYAWALTVLLLISWKIWRSLMASKSRVSILDYFNIVCEGENGKIESNCKACGTRIQAKRTVTSNFVTHLKVRVHFCKKNVVSNNMINVRGLTIHAWSLFRVVERLVEIVLPWSIVSLQK